MEVRVVLEATQEALGRKRRAAVETAAFLMHIPKTAGTSLLAVVEGEYVDGAYYAIYPGWESAKDEVVACAGLEGGLRAVIGHFLYGLHLDPQLRPLMPPQPAYATILRDPARRVVSLYNYIADSDDPIHRALVAEHPTLEDFLDHEWAHDAQASFLLGDAPGPGDTRGEIRARLCDDFAAVGLAERFDESVVLLASAFGWRLPCYVPPRNVGRSSPRRIRFEALDDRLVGRIRDANRLDQFAYDFVRDGFDARCAAIPDFQARLGRYRSSPVLAG